MTQDRQRALGRWSEWVGASGVSQDTLIRTLGLEHAAKADYAISRADTRAMVDAHTDGINFFLATTTALPVEFKILGTTPEPWEPWHSFAAYKMRNILMGHLDMKLWRARVVMKLGVERASQLFEGYPNGMLVTTPSGATHTEPNPRPYDELAAVWAQLNPLYEIDAGSNAWVVGGHWTTTGMPLVAGDSHRGLDTPSVYYQVRFAPLLLLAHAVARRFPADPRKPALTSARCAGPSRLRPLGGERLRPPRHPGRAALLPHGVLRLRHDPRQRRLPGRVHRELSGEHGWRAGV